MAGEDVRRCNQCSFRAESKKEGLAGVSEEMVAMSDHLMAHNPSPEQWHSAHEKNQAAKETAKKPKQEVEF